METRCFSFGPFVLIPDRQLLLREDATVRLGTRALDVLTILVQRAGEVIDKQELISLVWRDTFVDESNLKVNIAAMGRALDEDRDSQSRIATVIGRGYRFIESVQSYGMNCWNGPGKHSSKLPSYSKRLIGRDKIVHQLATQVADHRLVTIVGSGGIGKTAVAVAVAETLADRYESGACFADLGVLNDSDLVARAIAGALGLTASAENINERLITYLTKKEVLLVIDTCERVIDAAAEVVERIQSCCRRVHLLATSRESLRANGELVYRLPGLSVPPRAVGLTAEEVQTYPAVQLFIERTNETGGDNTIIDTDAMMIADLCRDLNGIPLAIELAARCVRSLGFDGLQSVSTDQFLLFNQGMRTGPLRQQSLAAALDWSFNLLPDNERFVLLRLSRLEDCFDLETGIAVGSDGILGRTETIECIANLVSKSLVERVDDDGSNFRLLDFTRHYASLKLISNDKKEISKLRGKHFDGLSWKASRRTNADQDYRTLTAQAS